MVYLVIKKVSFWRKQDMVFISLSANACPLIKTSYDLTAQASKESFIHKSVITGDFCFLATIYITLLIYNSV